MQNVTMKILFSDTDRRLKQNGIMKDNHFLSQKNFQQMPLLRWLWPAKEKKSLFAEPAHPICVIGDLHGRYDLLEIMLATIDNRDPEGSAKRIFVGDLIDRGPQSAAVLTRVHQLCASDPTRYICVMGNHERMMLDFLGDPERYGPRWFAAGGDQTLANFGLTLNYGTRDAQDQSRTFAEAMNAAIPVDLLAWLAALPLYWQEGSVLVSHAGADAKKAVNNQTENEMVWGNIQHKGDRKDGIWTVQGHKIVVKPAIEGRRIFTDTGAWQSGRLSAAWIDENGLDWIKVQLGNG